MTFKVDENLPSEAAVILRSAGHSADTTEDEGLDGADDGIIAEHLLAERRAILTLVRGFGDIRTYSPDRYHGIVVLRPARQDMYSLLAMVRRVVGAMDGSQIAGGSG